MTKYIYLRKYRSFGIALACLTLFTGASLAGALNPDSRFIHLKTETQDQVVAIPSIGTDNNDPEPISTETTLTTLGARTTGVSFLELVALYDLGPCAQGTGYFLHGPAKNSMNTQTTSVPLVATSGVLAPMATELWSDTRYYFTPVVEACGVATLGETKTAMTRKNITSAVTENISLASEEEPLTSIEEPTPSVTMPESENIPNQPLQIEASIENGVDIVRPDDAITYVATIFNLGATIVNPLDVVINLPEETRFIDTNLGTYETADHTVRVRLDALPQDTLAQIVIETATQADAVDGDLVTAQMNIVQGNTTVRAFDYDEYRIAPEELAGGPASAGRGFLPENPWGWLIAGVLLALLIAAGRYILQKPALEEVSTSTSYRGNPYTPQSEDRNYPYRPSIDN